MLKNVVGFTVLFLTSLTSHALDPASYHGLQSKSASGDQSASIMLISYHQGIYEAYQSIAMLNDLEIERGTMEPICLPSAYALSAESVERAIKEMIGTHDDPKNTAMYSEVQVAGLAIVGMSAIFPCK